MKSKSKKASSLPRKLLSQKQANFLNTFMPTTNKKRIITFCDALNEAHHQEMERDASVFVYGIETKVFGSLKGLEERFGKERFFTTPLSEDAATGFALGAAVN